MRIVIDMQGAQSRYSGSRGVGRYTLEMTKALIKTMPDSEFFLALNGKLPTERVMKCFEGILPRENIKTWLYHPHIPRGSTFEEQGGRPEEYFREWFLHQFQADIIWIPNLQEGEGETEIAASAKLTRGREVVATTLHDVSPILLNEDIIGSRGNLWYKKKIDYAGNCDLVLTDSKFCQEKIRLLYGEKNVRVAYCGYDKDYFCPDEEKLFSEAKDNFFLYCGGLDPHKNVSRLVEAMSLLDDKKHKLYIAGKNPAGMESGIKEYAQALGVADRVKLLGFVDDEKLRSLMQRCRAFIMPSYAEGFGLPALEAMACGAPTLVSDATSLKEVVPNQEARFAPESASELAELMDRVIVDTVFAQSLIDEGQEVAKYFTWESGAAAIKEAFESVAPSKGGTTYGLDDLCADLKPFVENDPALAGEIARSIEDSTLFKREQHIYIDASAVVLEDYLTGIQRVVYGYAGAMAEICRNLPNKKVKVIYSSPEYPSFYEVVVNEEGRFKKNPQASEKDAIEFYDGDILLMPDLHPGNAIAKTGYLKGLANRGVRVFTVVHDVIASVYGEFFNKDVVREFEAYLSSVSNFSGVIGDSNTTLQAYIEWCGKRNISFPPYYVKDYNHLGVDFAKRDHVAGDIPESGKELLEHMKAVPTVLMVATLEPRKMHKQVLSAMEILWDKGTEANLVFVGRQGWKVEKLAERIRRHPENGKKLHWLSGISDAYLKAVYESATGVVVASLIEGYGLPIIEGAHYGMPLLLRDIPVFREVAENKATYFEGEDAESLASAIEAWLEDISNGRAKDSRRIKVLSWEESAREILVKMDSSFFEKRNVVVTDERTARLQALCDSMNVIGNDNFFNKLQAEINYYFCDGSDILDLSGINSAEALDLLKQKVNLDGVILKDINNWQVREFIRFCQEVYYRLAKDAWLVVTIKEHGLSPRRNMQNMSKEKFKEILEVVGFEKIELKRDTGEKLIELPYLHSDVVDNINEFNLKIAEFNAAINSCEYILAARKEG